MNFAEVLVAALLLAGASSASLQIWVASGAASRTAEQRQEQLVQLDGALLAAEERLQQSLAATASPVCSLASPALDTNWMAAQLEQAPLPAGVARQVESQAGGVWLRLQAQGLPRRQRWLDAAALGYCTPPPATLEAGGNGTTI